MDNFSPTTRAALWMVFFCATMACLSGMIRYLSDDIPALEMVFFRNFFGFLFMLPFISVGGLGILKTKRMNMYGLRALFGTAAMSCWFLGVTMLPLSEATALSFTVPLFTTLGAVLILGEVVRIHRWMALVVGFIGALIIIRPGFEEIEIGALVVLASSFFIACAVLCVKSLSRTEHPTAIVFYMGAFMTPLSLIGAVPVWVWPEPEHYIWLVGMGVFASSGQIGLARAMKAADASVSMPYSFTNMIFASMIGYYFFAETLDVLTWVGACVIFASTLYITRREALLAKKAKQEAQ
ncbi:DMT family transporter [Terasakiella sp. A23]|uniref:DMT family transporter n=1 Tax=Terasakiella sp. FCG-A23 TaxID=3080561 RepID=UPI00295299AC|nr:DMT family transporter [Terasakiella sp. A23]MDV7338319.1 DMT family transporter [Terasakiella sp. A23]